jgi:hypothetical protein
MPARAAHRSRPAALPNTPPSVANKTSGLSQAEKFSTSLLQYYRRLGVSA